MGSLYEDHRTLYQSFAAAYGLTALAAWHLLSRAARADPNRFTVQQLLLMLVAGLCAGRTVSFLSHLDWHPPGAIGYGFTALTYLLSFGLNSVLVRFWSEVLHNQQQGARNAWGISFLYPSEYLRSARPALLYFNLLLGASTYVMLYIIHMETPLSPLVALIGSLVHTVVYFSLGCEAIGCAVMLYQQRRPPPGSRPTVHPATSAATAATASVAGWPQYAEILALAVALCLLVQGALTTVSVLFSQFFFKQFALMQSAYLSAELAPALLLLSFLCERPSSYMHHVAPAA